MNDQQTLAEFYQRKRPDLNVRANDSFLIERAGKPITAESLLIAASQLEGTLLLTPAYQSAWNQFVLFNPKKKSTAFRRQFLDVMRQKEIQSAEKHEYNSLLKELGREDLRGIPLRDLREIAATQRENNRRRSLNGSQLSDLALTERPLPTRGTLPSTWFGADISTPVALRMLAKKNIASFRALCERFGTTEVNKFLGVKPTIQPGYTKSVNI
jgi:hypothetical protein